MRRATVLVIDDKPNMLQMLKSVLAGEFAVETAVEARAAVERHAQSPFDAVVTDIRMPGMDGMEVLREVKRLHPETEVVIMTGHATVKQAVEAIKAGAYDYLTKPFEPEEMSVVLTHAIERKRLLERTRYLERQVKERVGAPDIKGKSAAMANVFSMIAKVVDADATVLVMGESGTGKELVARALHFGGVRKDENFVVVHCATIAHDLAESEIFGHSRGSFSGAIAAKKGLAEEADGGTLFLDDVDQIDIEIQAKLNRLIQEKEIRSVGATEWRKIDVRIVAATNRDLKALVDQGKFREDLYYRLNVFRIALPPLRARKEDLPELIAHCLQRHAARAGRPVPPIAPGAMEELCRHEWPGNVRELENTLERALLLAGGSAIETEHLGLPDPTARDDADMGEILELPYAEAIEHASAKAIRGYLLGILQRFKGNVTRAAEHARIERQSLHRLMKKHGVRSQDTQGDEGADEG